ncbi:MAG: GNAT family N-acetyltransferase, partial [Eudoraea sp.]|nr:GNAT family N-acetyltransferase [Eudoraea sp.]
MIKPITLENERVRLSPLTLENYTNLLSVASEPKLIQYSPSDIESPAALRTYVEIALDQQNNNSSLPFIIYDKKIGDFAGCTRYMNIDHRNKVLEIGATWI